MSIAVIEPAVHALRLVVRRRRLRQSLLAYLLFNMADYATWVALIVFAHGRGGAGAAAAIAVVQLIPPAVVSPFGAVIGDRLHRDHALALGYRLQALTMALAALALWADAPMPLIYGVAALVAMAAALTRPVFLAALPSLARRPADLAAANAMALVLEKGGVFLGPAVAALILGFAGPAVVFAVFAAGQMVAAFMVGGTRSPGRSADASPLRPTHAVRAVMEGLGELRHARGAALMIGYIAAAWLVTGAVELLAVVFALDVLGTDDGGPAALVAGLGVGGLIGATLAGAAAFRPRLAPTIVGAVLLTGLPIVLIAISAGLPVAIALAALTGAGASVLDIAVRMLLQKTVRSAVLSRVFGLQEGFALAAQAVGIAFVPALVAAVGPRGALALIGFLLPALVFLTWRRLVRLDAGTTVAPGLALLRQSPIFASLPAPELEQLARCLRAREAAAGETIIRQGQLGDRFYLIEQGSVDVYVDGLPRPSRGPGESFGEVALIRNEPRSATVRAASTVRLHWLSRDDFLSTLVGDAALRRLAETVAARTVAGDRPHVNPASASSAEDD